MSVGLVLLMLAVSAVAPPGLIGIMIAADGMEWRRALKYCIAAGAIIAAVAFVAVSMTRPLSATDFVFLMVASPGITIFWWAVTRAVLLIRRSSQAK